MLYTLVMITLISEIQQYRGLAGWLVVIAVLKLAVAHMDGWDNLSLTGSNMDMDSQKRQTKAKNLQ